MNKYGIFGGTFNPPHLAHSLLAKEVREKLCIDKIIFIPSAVPPLKEKNQVLEIKHRLEMARIAFDKFPYSEISEIEIKNTNEKSYTVDTLIKLHKQYESDSVKFFLILGIDNIIDFPKWKTPERLFELAEIIALNRPGYKIYDIKPEFAERIMFIDVPMMDISSTTIRDRVSNNMPINSLVLPEIEKYITRNNLYKKI
jgi:nicotinate-nucleotide adenylyltransferase